MSPAHHVTHPVVLAVVALSLAASSWGCREASGHGDAEAGVSYQRTVWEGDHEIFYEYDAPVAGAPVMFALHVSDLASGAPFESGRVTLSARGPEGQAVLAALDEPTRTGIWIIRATFPVAGRFDVKLDVPTMTGGSTSISLPPIDVASTPAEIGEPEPELEGIAFLKEQQWPFRVRTSAAVTRSLASTIRVPATVRAHPAGRVELVSPVAGAVHPPGADEGVVQDPAPALPALGTRIKAGDVLARIEPPLSGSDLLTVTLHHHELQVLEAELSVKLAQAKAEETRTAGALALAESIFERTARLAGVEAKSRRELEQARFEVENKKSLHEVSLAVTKLYADALDELHSHPVHDDKLLRRFPSIDVVAPIDGVIDRVRAVAGESVEASAPLFTVLDSRRVHLVARVPEHLASRLGSIESGTLSGAASGVALRVVHRSLELETDRTMPVIFEAANESDALAIGAAVEVRMPTAAPRDVTAIPRTAVVDVNGATVAFVQLAGELFEKRFVDLGARDDGWVEIIRGVERGERVVSDGAYLVHLASVGTSAPAHHHH